MYTQHSSEDNVKYIMQKNRQITTLTEKQHDALEFLCSARHELHNDEKAFFLTDDPKYKDFEHLLGVNGNGIINRMLIDVGLPQIDYPTDIFKVKTADAFKREDYPSEFLYELDKATACDKSKKIAENLNKHIELYLREVDIKYGTKYAPVGFYRYYKEPEAERVMRHFRANPSNLNLMVQELRLSLTKPPIRSIILPQLENDRDALNMMGRKDLSKIISDGLQNGNLYNSAKNFIDAYNHEKTLSQKETPVNLSCPKKEKNNDISI